MTTLRRVTITAQKPVRPFAPARRPALSVPLVLLATVAAVAVRIPFLTDAASPDEGGFLVVARQWNGPGRSLYTNYWVDRPPLLLLIFRIAADLGGLPALRLIGAVAVALTVAGAAWTAGQAAGPRDARRAAPWAAVTAAALSISPLLDAQQVNGELLAAPFITVGFGCLVCAARRPGWAGLRWAAAAGVLATAAVLIKQNMMDVAVFGVVLLAVAVLRKQLPRRRAAHLIAAGLIAVVVTVGVVALATVARGTSPHGVYEAMYPFRWKAGQVVAAHGSVHAGERLTRLVRAAAVAGIALVALAAVGSVARRPRSTVVIAMLAVLCFDVFSILAGASYWLHYLVQTVPAVAVTAGLLVARRTSSVRLLVCWIVIASTVATVVHGRSAGSTAQTVGEAIAAVAQPTDTIVVAYGHPDVVLASGLDSPYSQLWSLPVKTLDPKLTELDRVLASRQRPTWIVQWSALDSWGLDATNAEALVGRYYRPDGVLHGHQIYLRRDVRRSTPEVVQVDCTRCS